eukprot:GEZU01024346.1.p1 GENE.GEZU01024346.1~~GEZU01024346.1.p1  ORF type:complete len:271 (+),score=72.48 GEZU01024346.1:259-1071(+)
MAKPKNISHSLDPNRKIPKGNTNLRSKATINRLRMYKSKIKRDRDGNIVAGSVLSKATMIPKGKMARIQPDRQWFQNTRVIDQKELAKFREELAAKLNDPYNVVLKQAKLPMSLLQESDKSVRMNLLSTESFQDVFGKNKRRKKPKLSITNYEEMVQQAEKLNDDYDDEKDSNIKRESWYKTLHKDAVFSKGQSRRLWSELYKVIDSSDVLIQVLDARNPMGTRSPQIEKFLRTEKKHKHLVFVLNKCDLIPTWATVSGIFYITASVTML